MHGLPTSVNGRVISLIREEHGTITEHPKWENQQQQNRRLRTGSRILQDTCNCTKIRV